MGFGANLPRKRKVVIAKVEDGQRVFLDYSNRNFHGFDLRYIFFARVDFTGSDLTGSKFDRSVFKSCSINDCNITGASFNGGDADNRTVFHNNQGGEKANLDFITAPQELVRFDPDIVVYLQNKALIASFKRTNRDRLAYVLNWLTDYGRGLKRVAAISACLIVIFGMIYWGLALDWFCFTPGQPGIADFMILSLQRFINAGASVNNDSAVVQALFAFEGTIGLLLFSLLVAVFIKKLVATR